MHVALSWPFVQRAVGSGSQSLPTVRGTTSFPDTGRREPCAPCKWPGMDLPQVSTYVRRPPPGEGPEKRQIREEAGRMRTHGP